MLLFRGSSLYECEIQVIAGMALELLEQHARTDSERLSRRALKSFEDSHRVRIEFVLFGNQTLDSLLVSYGVG